MLSFSPVYPIPLSARNRQVTVNLDSEEEEFPLSKPSQELASFKSPKVSSLYRGIEEQKLINRKLPN